MNEKNYLNRNVFINSVNSNKIWSKSMTMPEIQELLEYLKNEISKYEFDTDKNFIMNSRRKALKSKIEAQLSKNDKDINELILESLFNFWEFVSDEYSGDFIVVSEDLGLSVQELISMDDTYRKKGIICTQEKEVILEMIQIIKNYMNERCI